MAEDAKLTILILAKDKASGAMGKVSGAMKKLGGAGKIAKIGLLAGAAGVVAIGAGLLKVGADFDKAFDTIAIGTGATGEALQGLKGDFKAVFSSIPTDMKSASAAIADFNTLTGFTGEALQTISKQALEAGRILGIDTAQLIDKAGKAFNIFDLDAAGSEKALDALFIVSQNTGIGLDKLTKGVQTFGPILKNAGFSIEETALFMGDLNKAGVDVSRVMPALNSFTRKLAAEGITDLKGGVIDAFEAIRNATTQTEALNIATEAFGAEGAQRMTSAIRSGALQMDVLSESLIGSEGAILRNAKATMSMGENFTILKNKALVLIEPLASGLFNALTKITSALIDDVIPAVSSFINFLKFTATEGDNLNDFLVEMPGFMRPVARVLSEVVLVMRNDVIPVVKEMARVFMEDIVPALLEFGKAVIVGILLPALAQFKQLIVGLMPAFKAVVGVLVGSVLPVLKMLGEFLLANKPILIGIAAVILLLVSPWLLVVAAIVLVLAKWDDIVTMLTVTIPSAISGVIESVERIPIIGEIFEAALNAVMAIVETIFGLIKNRVETAIEAIINIVQFWMAIFKGDWDEAWNEIKELVAGIWDGIKAEIGLVLGLIKTLIMEQLNLMVGIITDAAPFFLAAGIAIITGLWDGLKEAFLDVMAWVGDLPGKILDSIKSGFGILSPSTKMKSIGADILFGLLNGVVGGFVAVGDFIRSIPGRIVGAFVGAGSMLFDKGKQIVQGLINGLLSLPIPNPLDLIPSVGDVVGGIGGVVGGINPFHGGGVIPGPKGREVVIRALSGEGVISLPNMARLRRTGGVGTGAAFPSAPVSGARTVIMNIYTLDADSFVDNEDRIREAAIHAGAVEIR